MVAHNYHEKTKMEDVMMKRLIDSVGKDVKLVLQNGFVYAGEITGCDEKHLEILDYKTNSYHVFDLEYIKDAEVKA